MRTVIRGAATIEEYKEIKSQMEQLAVLFVGTSSQAGKEMETW